MSSEDQSNLKRKFSSKRRSKKKFRGVRPSEIVCQESEEQVELQLAAENVQSTKVSVENSFCYDKHRIGLLCHFMLITFIFILF